MELATQAKGKAQVAVVEMPVQWLDVGSWPALAETLPMDEHNNATQGGALIWSSIPTTTSSSATTPSISSAVARSGLSDMMVISPHQSMPRWVLPQEGERSSSRVKELVGKVRG